MTSRIHRGFHRIGVVLAVPLFIAGAWIGGREAWQHQRFGDPHVIVRLTMADGKVQDIDADDIEVASRKAGITHDHIASGEVKAAKLTPVDYDPFSSNVEFPRDPDYRGAIILISAALALYAAARAVGWVLAGFLGPGRP